MNILNFPDRSAHDSGDSRTKKTEKNLGFSDFRSLLEKAAALPENQPTKKWNWVGRPGSNGKRHRAF